MQIIHEMTQYRVPQKAYFETSSYIITSGVTMDLILPDPLRIQESISETSNSSKFDFQIQIKLVPTSIIVNYEIYKENSSLCQIELFFSL